jgi:hypothetical protein
MAFAAMCTEPFLCFFLTLLFNLDINNSSALMWAGIVDDVLVDPHVLPQRLTGNCYKYFLENNLPTILEDLPLVNRAHMVHA